MTRKPAEITSYWNYRDEVVCLDGLMFKGLKLIISEAYRKEMLELVHETHSGTVKCRSRAKEVMSWPSVGSGLEKKVSHCSCAKVNMKIPPKEPLINLVDLGKKMATFTETEKYD